MIALRPGLRDISSAQNSSQYYKKITLNTVRTQSGIRIYVGVSIQAKLSTQQRYFSQESPHGFQIYDRFQEQTTMWLYVQFVQLAILLLLGGRTKTVPFTTMPLIFSAPFADLRVIRYLSVPSSQSTLPLNARGNLVQWVIEY